MHQPYTFSIERSSVLPHQHAQMLDDGYALQCSGNKYILATPALEAFDLHTTFEFRPAIMRRPTWSLIFAYDEVNRTGLSVRLCYKPEDGAVTVRLMRVDGLKRTELTSLRPQAFDLQAKTVYTAEIHVKKGVCYGEVYDVPFSFALDEDTRGSVALERSEFTGEIVFHELRLTSDETPAERELYPETRFTVPCTCGGMLPYRFFLSAFAYENGRNILHWKFDGGLADRMKEARVTDQYSTETDRFRNPYLRLYQGNEVFTLYIRNGQLTICDPNVHWEFLKGYWEHTELPIDGFAAFPFEGFDKVAFGFENVNCKGYQFQGGEAWEFVYAPDGQLLYEGTPRHGNRVIELSSGADKRIVGMIPKDLKYYDEAYLHAVRNHYFFEDETIRFAATLHVPDDIRDYELHAVLEDVYGNVLLEIPHKDGAFTLTGLKLGVYHIRIRATLGGKSMAEKRAAFEVFDDNPDHSPQAASGLPFLYSTPNEDRYLIRDVTDPYSPKPDCNTEHYYSCSCFTPAIALDREIWRLTKLYRRKYYAWVNNRTVPHYKDIEDHVTELYRDVFANADYLDYTLHGSGDEELLKRTRLDVWRAGFYTKTAVRLLREYLAAKGDTYTFDELTNHVLDYVLKTYGSDYCRFIADEVEKGKIADKKKVLAINPKLKLNRCTYPPYATPYASGYSTIWYGEINDRTFNATDGFCQFEDYPFSCSYATHRGAWQVATVQLYCEGLTMYPEIYGQSFGGCPDGLVAYANPPLGEYRFPIYFQTTQAYEYAFNAYFFRDGAYRYWTDRGVMVRDTTVAYSSEFIKNWYAVHSFPPAHPMKTIAFVADYIDRDECYRPDYKDFWGWSLRYNLSEANQSFLYAVARESGINAPFSLLWKDIAKLNAKDFDILVLPSLSEATTEALASVRQLHAAGVKLIAAGTVEGLEELFGVKAAPASFMLHTLTDSSGVSEGTHPIQVDTFYAPDGAKTLLYGDSGSSLVMSYRGNLLINAGVPLLNIDTFIDQVQNGRESISLLLCEVVRRELYAMTEETEVLGSCGCGVTAFHTTDGKKALVCIDYSPYTQSELFTRLTEYCVSFAQGVALDVSTFTAEEDPVILRYDDGSVRKLLIRLRPQQSAVFELK